uniref:RING-type domain-containing protein n=1 Tax=Leersia perrieri TaxID=77586 RepID=A0A0D9X2X0_9ORYZ
MDRIAPAAAATASAAAHGSSWRLSYTAASVVVLLLYLTARFICLYNKNATAAAVASSPTPLPFVDRAVAPVWALPVLVQMEEAAAAECAVCLAEVREGETARVLPACGHAFHEGCIVTWLRVNTTCPLCRAAVLVSGK